MKKTSVEWRIAKLEAQVRKLQSAMERSDHQRMAPQRANQPVDPEVPEAIKA